MTYSYKLYTDTNTLTIRPRIFHWATNIEKYIFCCMSTLLFNTTLVVMSYDRLSAGFLCTFFAANTNYFPWPFLITIPYILGLQCVFFRAICHMWAVVVTFLYFLDYNSIYSGMSNVFFWGCNACFSEHYDKHVFLGLQCMFFSKWYTVLIQFAIHNILFEENKKTRSVQSIFLQPVIRHGSEPTFLRTTIK